MGVGILLAGLEDLKRELKEIQTLAQGLGHVAPTPVRISKEN
jgi:hypothetical protein